MLDTYSVGSLKTSQQTIVLCLVICHVAKLQANAPNLQHALFYLHQKFAPKFICCADEHPLAGLDWGKVGSDMHV